MKPQVLIGKIIREHREKKNLTQLDLARQLGYGSTQFVSLFERGLSKCPPRVLGKLCSILGIPKSRMLLILVTGFTAKIRKEMDVK